MLPPTKKNCFTKTILINLAIVLTLVFHVLAPCLLNGFSDWDDPEHLLKNAAVRSLNLDNIKNIFTQTINDTYIPLTTFSYSLEYLFLQYDPFIYHLTNLLLHLAVTALIFLLALRLKLPILAALFSSLLFGIHPMHTESVVWITERKDVLYSLFYLLAILKYLDYQNTFSKKSFLLSLFFGFLSILSKPMALSLPLILLLFDWLNKRKFNRNCLLDKLPFCLTIFPIAWITYSLNSRVPTTFTFDNILVWIWTASFYLKKFFFPVTLLPLYTLPKPISLFSTQYLTGLIIFLFLITIIILFFKDFLSWAQNKDTKTNSFYHWILFAFLYYFLSLFFIFRFDAFDKSIVADRFMYLPSLGLCLLFGISISTLSEYFRDKTKLGRCGLWIGLFVLLIFLSLKTHTQTFIWNRPLTFWSYIIHHDPNSPSAYRNRGIHLTKQGRLNAALNDYNKAIELNPVFAMSYNNRGYVYQLMKNNKAAIKDYSKAIELDNLAIAYFNRADVYTITKNFDKALEDILKAKEFGLKFNFDRIKKIKEELNKNN